MSTASPNSPGHSADVRMELRLDGHVLPIAQLGPDFLILTHPLDHPPAEAEIALSIDGHESRWPVRLHEGISATQRRTRIRRIPHPNGSPVG
jgi:hypothetical protein